MVNPTSDPMGLAGSGSLLAGKSHERPAGARTAVSGTGLWPIREKPVSKPVDEPARNRIGTNPLAAKGRFGGQAGDYGFQDE